MDVLMQMFPGISSFMFQEPLIIGGRIFLIVFGIVVAYMGFNRTLEPLIMVPMGMGMTVMNCASLFLGDGSASAANIGTIILDPMITQPDAVVNIMQINFLQPIYNLMFSNGLIACMLFMGIGAMCEIGFILAKPWITIMVAILAEMGTFAALILGYKMGLTPGEAAAVATIGGADGPMVLFASLIMAKELFVPIAIIAYLYLSLTYIGYPYLIKALIPAKYRGIDTVAYVPDVPQKTKFIFIVLACTLICLLLPVSAPLVLSFFLGMAIKEAQIEALHAFLENTLTYFSTLFLGLVLGVLCEAQILFGAQVGKLVIIGIVALAVSGLGGILGGWIAYFITKKDYNPIIGIAGVSCLPTTAKIAQKVANESNPYAMILPLAMGANVAGLIVSAIATGVFISTISLLK